MELLDAGRSAVVIIDLQGRLMETIVRPRLVVEGTVRLLKLAELFRVPVVMTEQYPKGLGGTHAEVRGAYDALTVPKHLVEKTSFSCCGEAAFGVALDQCLSGVAANRRQLVVAGIEAHVCVMQTVIEHLCWECVSSRGEEYRRHALDRMAQAGAALTNHESVAFEWARDKNHPAFRAVSALFKEGQPG